MELEYVKANIEDAKLLIDIYNASFYRDYIKYGKCPGYGKTKEMMESAIRNYPKFIILCDGKPVGAVSSKEIEDGVFEVGCLCIIPEYQGLGIGTKAFQFIWSYYESGKKFTLVTPEDKEDNVKFYTEKCGFHISGREMDGNIKLVRLVRDR